MIRNKLMQALKFWNPKDWYYKLARSLGCIKNFKQNCWDTKQTLLLFHTFRIVDNVNGALNV